MKIASYNVNSVRARIDPVVSFLRDFEPDILGLQETKVPDLNFPAEPIADLGYEIGLFGEKNHYGVALLSNEEPAELRKGFPGDAADAQRRLITGTFELEGDDKLVVINGYFPQGENRSHEVKFPAKMKFYDDLMKYLESFSPEQNIVVMGDLNIAPDDKDLGLGSKAQQWIDEGSCSFLPEERQRIRELLDWGLFDTFRELHPEEDRKFSYFDYRTMGWESKEGMRIDLILATKPLLDKCKAADIDYKLRDRPKASDHCPVWAEFDIELAEI